ncbi:MAG: TrkH family potassium uptake protein [Bacteroidales bacterium]|nr:TrkH family potassium uptake protein [Bacteroidales bacterium]
MFFIIGLMLFFEGLIMLVPAFVALYYGEPDSMGFFVSTVITETVGFVLAYSLRRHSTNISKRDSYLLVVMVWFIFALFGTLPYLLSGFTNSFVDAFYESMSGITTTGSTIVSDFDSVTHGVFIWRSLTQWLGGMGIIALSIVLLPILGMGGMQVFSAEASITRADKIHPKIAEMAKYMWIFYVVFTIIEIVLLVVGDMPLFDAICHSFSTIATGGFSTKADSIGAFNSPYIESVVMVFMFLGGVNFALYYALIVGKGRRILADDELKSYIFIVILFSFLLALILIFIGDYDTTGHAVRDSMFHIISVLTGSGFTTTNYSMWPVATSAFIALLMFMGTCTGSTSGGLKLMRLIVVGRNIINEVKRAIHPTAIVNVRYNGRSLTSNEVFSVLSFFVLYFVIILIGIFIVTMFGYNLEDTYGLVVNSLSNVGCSIGNYGPSASICDLHPVVKMTMSVLMLIGRLEIFTVILIFTPTFWKR